MAKPIALSILVEFCLMYWYRPNNYRSADHYGSDAQVKETKDSLAIRGWRDSNTIPATKITDVEVKACMEERAAQWAAYKTDTSPEGLVKLKVFENLLTKNGKIIEPQYSGNAGFRRGGVYFDAMCQRYGMVDEQGNKLEITGLIPIVVKTYKTLADRIIDQQTENSLQNVGNVPMDDRDKLRVARALFNEGQREIRLREIYPVTTAQKMFNLCLANKNWPNLNIYDRAFLPPTEPGSYKLSAVRHNELISFNNRFDADLKRSEGKMLTEKERTMAPINEEVVSTYFKTLGTNTGNADKIMSKKDIEAQQKQSPIKLFSTMASAIMDNSPAALVQYLPYAEQLNTATKLVDTGKGALMGKAVDLAARDDAAPVVELLHELITGGKLFEARSALEAVKAGKPAAPSVPNDNQDSGKSTSAA